MSEMIARLLGALSTPGPLVGVEIAADGVTGAALTWVKSTPKLIGHARVRLPYGAPPTDRGVHQRHRPRRRRGRRPSGVEEASDAGHPNRPRGARQRRKGVVRQVRPGPWAVGRPRASRSVAGTQGGSVRVEDAQLAYTPGVRLPGGGQEFVVALIRRDIVEEYEGVCAAAGAHAGLVDLATFNLVNAATAMSPPSHVDWLLLHVALDDSTLAIVRGPDLMFFRNRPTKTERDLADFVHQSVMYYEDRLEGRGIARTVLVVSAETAVASEIVRHTLEERLGTAVERLASVKVTSALGVDPSTLDPLGAPIGLVMREQLSAA